MKPINNKTRKFSFFHYALQGCIAVILSVTGINISVAMDDETAMIFLKEHGCTKCHSVNKEKMGPAYKKIAEKHKGEADAMDKLYKQVTTGPEFEREDGSKEEHKILEEDPQVIKDVLEWILAL